MLETNRNKASAQQAAHHAIGIASEEQSDSRPANTTLVLDKFETSPRKIVNPVASIRDVEDDDAAGLAEIIAAIMGEFPGCVFDLDADFPELKRPKSSFTGDGGRFWVVESSAISAGKRADRSSGTVPEIVGCFGFLPAEDPEGIELQRVYLRPELRGTGLATRMFKIVRAVAHQRSARFIELWTDSRFKAAQRFYEKLGFRRLPNERLLNDRSRSSEYHYILPLR
jgi:putative acetyltransferase